VTYSHGWAQKRLIKSRGGANFLRVIVLLNAAAGLERKVSDEEIAAAFAAQGASAEIRSVPAPELCQAARAAAGEGGVDIVALAGGDGTINAGAAALADTGHTLGILPLGTLNHFARDLGIPQDLEGAVRTMVCGRVREVDVGEANGRVFVNNSSIGAYPAAVADRELRRTRDGQGKWPAMVRAALATLHRYPLVTVTLRMLEGEVRITSPVVFVGNNRYDVDLFRLGARPALDHGELWLYVLRDTGRFGFVRLGLRALLGRLRQSRDYEALALPELLVDDRRAEIPVAIDGEVVHMRTPVRYRIRPRALRVMAPIPEA
jgi:diacylglycerol kinase family enzyme